MQQTNPVPQEQTPSAQAQKKSAGRKLAEYFTATRVAYIAIFTALSYVLYLFDFSLLPGTPVSFLKLDFSNAFVMIGGFALGPVAGVIIAVLKELIHGLTIGNTMFVGELANILFILPYMLIPAIIYKKHKGFKVVILSLLAGCVAQLAVVFPINYLLNFPAFYVFSGFGTWQQGQQLTVELWQWVLAFNAIKDVLITASTLLLYKPLSRLIKATSAKLEGVRAKRAAASDKSSSQT